MLFFYAKKQKMSECFFSHTPTFIVEPNVIAKAHMRNNAKEIVFVCRKSRK